MRKGCKALLCLAAAVLGLFLVRLAVEKTEPSYPEELGNTLDVEKITGTCLVKEAASGNCLQTAKLAVALLRFPRFSLCIFSLRCSVPIRNTPARHRHCPQRSTLTEGLESRRKK